MKLKSELIRKILLCLEETFDGHSQLEEDSLAKKLAERFLESQETVSQHLDYLKDCNMLVSVNHHVSKFTPQGYNYLDSIRNIAESEKIPLPHSFSAARTNEASVSVNIGDIGKFSGNFAVSSNNVGDKNSIFKFKTDFGEVQSYIDKDSSLSEHEKYLLRRLSVEIETVLKENQPIKKGMLSRFSELLENHSAAVATVFQPFIYELLKQVQ